MKRQVQFFFVSLFLLNASLPPVLAHNIKTSADVGVTFHIEPDHNPVVGDSNQAWFALTRQGGELIPLAECDCNLKVYLESATANNTLVLNPPLHSISPEKYQNIPGADIVFPQSGIYQLELTGKPKTEGDFTPFQVSYPVTVKPQTKQHPSLEKSNSVIPPEETIAQSAIAERKSQTTNLYPWILGLIAGAIGLTVVFKSRQNR